MMCVVALNLLLVALCNLYILPPRASATPALRAAVQIDCITTALVAPGPPSHDAHCLLFHLQVWFADASVVSRLDGGGVS